MDGASNGARARNISASNCRSVPLTLRDLPARNSLSKGSRRFEAMPRFPLRKFVGSTAPANVTGSWSLDRQGLFQTAFACPSSRFNLASELYRR